MPGVAIKSDYARGARIVNDGVRVVSDLGSRRRLQVLQIKGPYLFGRFDVAGFVISIRGETEMVLIVYRDAVWKSIDGNLVNDLLTIGVNHHNVTVVRNVQAAMVG